MTYAAKVHMEGPDTLVIESGGIINVKSGGAIQQAGAAGAALTTQLTTITPADAAGTPDYAIAAVTQTTPFGFSNAAEAITLLYVIKNLQVRVAEMEVVLEAAGLVTGN